MAPLPDKAPRTSWSAMLCSQIAFLDPWPWGHTHQPALSGLSLPTWLLSHQWSTAKGRL
jgi:hypothetical protein